MNLLSNINLTEDLVFQNIRQQTFENMNANKTTLKNSIISACNFNNVDLNHSDLLSSKLFKTNFCNVSFVSSDMFSLWFSECIFDNVDFSNAGIEDITFINCQFLNCKFNNVGLKRCFFKNSTFIGIEPLSSSIISNQYYKCTFEKCKFSGSFQYQIFEKCKFVNVIMEYSLLKFNYGFATNKSIHYMKNNIDLEKRELYSLLINECQNQCLFLNAIIVKFNTEDSLSPILIIKSMDAIEEMLANNILIRNEEIPFLKQIYQNLYNKDILSPLIIYTILNKAKNIINKEKGKIECEKICNELFLLYSDLYLKFCSFCDYMQKNNPTPLKYDCPVFLYIHYQHKPIISLSDILNQCLPNTFTRIRGEEGTFHEIVEILPPGIEIFKIFISVLGIIVPIIYSENGKKIAKKPKIRKTVNLDVINQSNVNNSAKYAQQICKSITSAGLFTDDLGGYNNTNITEIEIQYNINIQV